MKNTTKCLLDVLLYGMYGKTVGEIPCEDWASLYRLAKVHSVENIFYHAIKDMANVPAEVKDKAKRQYWSNVHQQISQDYYAGEVFLALEKVGIKYVPLKGFYLRKLYPMPELRTSCDIDLFYDSSRTDDLSAVMREQGFTEEKGGPNHSVWMKDSVTFEPHFYLLSDNDGFHAYYENVWSRLTQVAEDRSLYAFSDEDFYIFFIVHAAKHFTHGGFGVRTVLDLHVYNQTKTLDKEYLTAEFDKLGLVKFVAAIEKLAECWFGGAEMDEDTAKVSEYVMESGTYGVSLHRVMLNNVKEKSVKGSKVSYLLETLFLPYKQMKIRYPILTKMPILLPFYWVIRWFAVLFKRRANITKTVNTIQTITDDKVEKYSKILEITEVPLD